MNRKRAPSFFYIAFDIIYSKHKELARAPSREDLTTALDECIQAAYGLVGLATLTYTFMRYEEEENASPSHQQQKKIIQSCNSGLLDSMEDVGHDDGDVKGDGGVNNDRAGVGASAGASIGTTRFASEIGIVVSHGILKIEAANAHAVKVALIIQPGLGQGKKKSTRQWQFHIVKESFYLLDLATIP